MVEKYFYYHPEALMSELQPTNGKRHVGIRLFQA
jgi:hypothetical protein